MELESAKHTAQSIVGGDDSLRTKFGVFLDPDRPRGKMIGTAILAEKCGFDSIWVADHLVDLPPYADYLEPWTLLATIGAKTRRVMLGTGVTDTLRAHPARTAHTVATLDELSNGRAMLGIGAGEAMNLIPFGIAWGEPEERAERLREAIEVIKLLWASSREKPATHKGKYYSLSNAYIDQHLVQKPHPPIYVGSLGSQRTLRIVAEVGDGWLSWLSTLETFKRRIEVIKSAAAAAQRRFEQIDRVAVLYALITENPRLKKKAIDANKRDIVTMNPVKVLREFGYEGPVAPNYQLALPTCRAASAAVKAAKSLPDEIAEDFLAIGSVDQCKKKVESYVRAGATHVVIRPALGPSVLSQVRRTLAEFARNIMPDFRG